MNARGRTQFAPTEKDRECEISLSFFYTSCRQGIVCYTFQVNGRAKVSLLLWEKVAAVGLADEELVLRLVTPHPPLTRSPVPHWGRLFVRPDSSSIFLTSTAFVDTKAKPRARRGED